MQASHSFAATVDYTGGDLPKELSLCVYILIKEPVFNHYKADIGRLPVSLLDIPRGHKKISYHTEFPGSES